MLVVRVIKRLLYRIASGARSSWPRLLVGLLLVIALPAVAYWRGFGFQRSDVGVNASEMEVERLEQAQSRINLVLKEKSGPRRLVVSVGQAEAFSIVQDMNPAARLEQPVTAYAMTRSIADGLGVKVQRVVVNNVTDSALFARVVLVTDSREVSVDVAPSDAIALAMRSKAPIFVDQVVLDKAGAVSGR